MATPMDTQTTKPSIPQTRPLKGQVKNSAGGYAWSVDDLTRLRRFLCLGSEGGTYYASEQKLGRENAVAILRLLSGGRGSEVVKEIVEFSVEGRAAKQDPTIFALALCARDQDAETKRLAYESLNRVCRIPTHLFMFVSFCESLSSGTGWGRAHRRAIQNWYLEKSPQALAQLVTKYQQREGWSHLDLLRLSHPKTEDPAHACVLKYVVKGLDECWPVFVDQGPVVEDLMQYLQAVDSVKVAVTEGEVVRHIKQYKLVREHIPTKYLNSKGVWGALLLDMPMTAMIRNLGKMSSLEVLKPGSEYSKLVCQRLSDEVALRAARLHPFNILVALITYKKGHGVKGKLNWTVNENIVTALNNAFYKSFKFVEPTGQRYLLALDVSGSMCTPILGSPVVTARVASAAMAMVTARTEQSYHLMGFSDTLVPLKIKPTMTLENVCEVIEKVPMGGTDCALPMIYAKKKRLQVDVFVVYTDNETWFGKVHPSVALQQYRKSSGLASKLIVCGMTASGFTIADPDDGGMLDMAGFDSAAPEIIRNFSLGIF